MSAGHERTAVVLIPGYLCPSTRLYFLGLEPLRARLARRGMTVLAARQPRTGGVAGRAQTLAARLAGLPHKRLVLVGHSMGGLDARYVASRLDPQGRIRHVITLGTPHLGSSLAEWALAHHGWKPQFARLVDRGALRDLTPEGASRLRALAPDRPDVVYQALAGRTRPERLGPLLRELSLLVHHREGENDGLVAAHSALAGRPGMTLDVDHFSLIGATALAPSTRVADWLARRAAGRLAMRQLYGLITMAASEDEGQPGSRAQAVSQSLIACDPSTIA